MFNRYAYTFNDPVNYTDPDAEVGKLVVSGYKVTKRVVKSKGDFKGAFKEEFVDYVDNFKTLTDGSLDLGDVLAIVDLATGVDGEIVDDVSTGLKKAEQLKDTLGDALGKKAATVTAGFNKKTGAVAAGRSCGANCAEDVVTNALGGNKNDIVFTKAKRPRTGQEKSVCTSCESRFGRDKFPEDTKFESDGFK